MRKKLPPPEHLSENSKELWRSLVPSTARSPGRLTLMRVALEALDRADQAREILASESLTTRTEGTGAIHINPLVKVEKEARQQFVRCWANLHLEWDRELDG